MVNIQQPTEALPRRQNGILDKAQCFNILSSTSPEPEWLRKERNSAWELYLQAPMPSPGDPEWHRSEIDQLDLGSLRNLPFKLNPIVESDLPNWLKSASQFIESPAAIVAQSTKGVWSKPLPEHLSKQGIIFCPLLQAVQDYPDLVKRYIDSDSPKDVSERLDSKFGLLNKALFSGGIFLYIPPNVVIERPFLSFSYVDHSDASDNDPSNNNANNIGISLQPVICQPRLILVADSFAKAQLVHVFASEGNTSNSTSDKPSLFNALSEVHLSTGSRIDYVELQRYKSHTFALSETYNIIKADAHFDSLIVASGSHVKGEVTTSLEERGASSNIQGLVLGKNKERFNFNTIQEHNAPDTKSNINFRVALKGESTSVYQGIVKVAKIAQGTNAFQSNKNLLLGVNAHADSIPKLEILANDVKCSHGATVGPVDLEQLFYLMTRGLSYQEAEELVVSGFFRQVLESCPVDGITDWVTALITEATDDNNSAVYGTTIKKISN